MDAYKYQGVLQEELSIVLERQSATFEKGCEVIIFIVKNNDGTKFVNEQDK
jgi:hypothetical protein